MFLRKYWLPLSVFLVLIVGIGLYLLPTQLPKEPIVIYKPVEPLPKSEVKAPVVQPVEEPVAVSPKTKPHPYDELSAEEQEAYRQRSIAITLEYLPEKLELEKANRDLIKQRYDQALNALKHFEEKNLQRERNVYDTSPLKKQIAEVKAELDMRESVISHLEKWRDEHAKK